MGHKKTTGLGIAGLPLLGSIFPGSTADYPRSSGFSSDERVLNCADVVLVKGRQRVLLFILIPCQNPISIRNFNCAVGLKHKSIQLSQASQRLRLRESPNHRHVAKNSNWASGIVNAFTHSHV